MFVFIRMTALLTYALFRCDGKELTYCDEERAYSEPVLGDIMKKYDGGFTDEWRNLSITIESMGWPGQKSGYLVDIWVALVSFIPLWHFYLTLTIHL